MATVKKRTGEYPVTTAVLASSVDFDHEGKAEVEDEAVLEVFRELAHEYEIVGEGTSEDDATPTAPEDTTVTTDAADEAVDETPEPTATTTAPKRAPRKAPAAK